MYSKENMEERIQLLHKELKTFLYQKLVAMKFLIKNSQYKKQLNMPWNERINLKEC